MDVASLNLFEFEQSRSEKPRNESSFADLLKSKPIYVESLPLPGMRGEVPSIKLPCSCYQSRLEKFKFSLIGRFDLQKIRLVEVWKMAGEVWKLNRGFCLIPLGKGYFTIQLECEEDKVRVWGGDSVSQAWDGNWEDKSLLSISRIVGHPIQVDENTMNARTGFYASVLTEIDMAKPISSKIFVEGDDEGFMQEMVIGHLPKFCNNCKVIGHVVYECRELTLMREEEEEKKNKKKEGAEGNLKKKKKNKKKNKKNKNSDKKEQVQGKEKEKVDRESGVL
ncbi:hypothetical protein GIB67_014948 [Kingdonia uniflora]|uniref:DUF4283 domain-containing protein n=1 Tax=Kingdonia uniflora TaxID=39325 RepID=A0A7J7MTI5_9MAGN|nr:hypothetical protein GIB67_014948 [Kingdonia uniflora]